MQVQVDDACIPSVGSGSNYGNSKDESDEGRHDETYDDSDRNANIWRASILWTT